MSRSMILEHFAGAGGISEGLRIARVPGWMDALGIETDEHACRTAELAGHARELCDVRETRPRVSRDVSVFAAGPPCQSFSAAGAGAGRPLLDALRDAASVMFEGWTARRLRLFPENALRAVLGRTPDDERSVLVLEPLHTILTRRPRAVLLEQVPAVLPLWEHLAGLLRGRGYSAVAGVVRAEQHGVPQTRRRAVLLASLDHVVALPVPTHSTYHPRDPGRLDPGVLPWVSMADALSWGMSGRPSLTVTGGGSATGGAEVFGMAARDRMRAEGRWVPGHAVAGDTSDLSWTDRRPSPTVVGSFAPDVIAAPGYRRAGDPPRQRTPGSVRVTVAEAGVLQSFGRDHPWSGTKGRQHQQVGDAMPPLLAAACFRALGVATV
jgi:DNA (cytosine-5)-methyltransferase 1